MKAINSHLMIIFPKKIKKEIVYKKMKKPWISQLRQLKS